MGHRRRARRPSLVVLDHESICDERCVSAWQKAFERWDKEPDVPERVAKKRALAPEVFLTTQQVADRLGVRLSDVVRAMWREELAYCYMPGSRHRRVLLSELRRFAEAHGMPLREGV